jgi:hypothetical protein
VAMKKILFLLLLNCFTLSAFAQRIIEKHLPYKEGQTANLNLKFADSIKVRYWDKSEVYVKIRAVINNNRLNDALLVTDKSTAGEVGLNIDFDQEKIKEGKLEDCPGEKRSSWRNSNNGSEHYLCKEINYQVFLPRNAKLQLETIDGNIDIDGATSTVHAKTISGYVDMNWPNAQGADVAMKTITGEVYTDLDLAMSTEKQKHPIVGYQLEGKLHGGGPEVRLESISNDIYLRKKK